MDALTTDTLTVLLASWGYAGLFIASLLAGSVLPFSSELVLFALLRLGLYPTLCLLFATLGNTAGSLSCYLIGRLGRVDWMERYLHVSRSRVRRMQHFLQGKGALMGFFAFLPTLGEVISIALGFLRSNLLLTTLSMAVGKFVRYLVIYWLAANI